MGGARGKAHGDLPVTLDQVRDVANRKRPRKRGVVRWMRCCERKGETLPAKAGVGWTTPRCGKRGLVLSSGKEDGKSHLILPTLAPHHTHEHTALWCRLDYYPAEETEAQRVS